MYYEKNLLLHYPCRVMRNPLCLSQGSGLDNDDEKVEIIMKPINKTQ